MKTSLRLALSAIALGAALCSPVRAQPASATFRPALVDAFSSTYTFSGTGDLNRGNTRSGELSLSRFDFSVSGRVPLKAGMTLIPGVAYSHTTLDTSAGVPLPGSVQELSLSLGVRGALAQKWVYLVALRPGFYGQKLVGDSFNAPLFLAAFYRQSETLTWTFGVTANSFNDNPVMPVIGVQWKFAPDWQFDVGFPRTGVSYKVDSNLTVRGGLSVLGGGYRITENLGVPAPGIARLNNTFLDLTEIRLGAGLAYKFKGGLELDLDAGVTTLRRFEYPDRNFRLNSDNVGWLSVSLNHRF
jgi:hypothetical protein